MSDVYTNNTKHDPVLSEKYINIDIIIALWALSEATLGGVLHAFRIPLTGLFINSAAVLYMVLIASSAQKKGVVLKATIVVMIVKGMVSPHTPLNAFIAVGFQGLMGEYLLRSRRFFVPASILLGLVTLLQSAVQKIIVLTIVYGNNLWQSIDVFGNFVIRQIPFINTDIKNLEISFWLIAAYIFLHLVAGFSIGFLATKVPPWIEKEVKHEKERHKIQSMNEMENIKVTKKKKIWLLKPSTFAIFILAVLLILLSYTLPEISERQGIQSVIMIIRSVCIMLLWYTLVSPVFIKLYKKYLNSKKHIYSHQVQKTIQILPTLRLIVYQKWNQSREYSGLKRLITFIQLSLISILSAEYYTNETD
jgi:hypothetical protein